MMSCSKCGAKYGIVEDTGLCLKCYQQKPKKHKYRAKKAEYNGRVYPSIKQAKRAHELDILRARGDVWFYLEEVPFRLPGKKTYRLDFLIKWNDGRLSFEDVKGVMTPVSKIKIDQVQELYGIEIEVI